MWARDGNHVLTPTGKPRVHVKILGRVVTGQGILGKPGKVRESEKKVQKVREKSENFTNFVIIREKSGNFANFVIYQGKVSEFC